jgi:hypothetical protein
MNIKALAAALAGTTLVVAGCGSSAPTAATTGASSPNAPIVAAYKFSACMRDHGVSNFPDPRVTSRPGGQSIAIGIDPTISGSPQFKSAQRACQGIVPGAGPQSAAQQAAQQRAKTEHLLAFARCARSHGITSFPDPTPQGQINPQMLAAAGVDLHAPGVIAAARACVPAAGGAVTQAAISQATGGH